MTPCFILGAGFSKPCGLPLASELTAAVFEHAFPSEGHSAPGIQLTGERREDRLRLCRQLYPGKDFEKDWPDFEEFITLLDEWSLYQKEYEQHDRSGEPMSYGHLKKVLLKDMAQLMCEKSAAVAPDALNLVKPFVRHVLNVGGSVISFNWDTVIEIACRQLDVAVSYKEGVPGNLTVAKPHGSVNLAEMTRGEWQNASKSMNVFDLETEWESGDNMVVRAVDPADATSRTVFRFDAPALVEPTVRKAYRSEWIQSQWRMAFDLLRRADKITVIGFSMPPTDYRPRVLLQASALDREKRRKLRIIDPAVESVGRRYAELVKDEIEKVPSDWTAWMRNGADGSCCR